MLKLSLPSAPKLKAPTPFKKRPLNIHKMLIQKVAHSFKKIKEPKG